MSYNQNPNPNPNPNRKPKKVSPYWFYLVLGIALVCMWAMYGGGGPEKTQWHEVINKMLPQGDVQKITVLVNQSRVEVELKKKNISKEPALRLHKTRKGSADQTTPPRS